MLTERTSTFPLPSEDHHHHHQQTPRASSEHEARSEPRTSTSDEAQACFNLILILRNDTQHLIALRNDNIQSLEETAVARPLLTEINEAITAATRSIHELGPFLERHRWPPEPPSRTSIRLRVLRKRSRSLSVPSASTASDCALSPEELFSRTLALTAQHNAILCALAKLEGFLVHGSAALNDEDRRRHDATQSWWQQRRSEFENVGLIQSIIQGPRRSLRRCADGAITNTTTVLPAKVDRPKTSEIGVAVTSSSPTAAAAILPSISEHDDGKSETLALYEQSVRSAGPDEILNGLRARPRARPESLLPTHCHLPCESPDAHPRLAEPRPRTHPQPPPAIETAQTGSKAIETPPTPPTPPDYAIPRLPLSRFNSDARHPSRIAMGPLPPLIGLQPLLTGAHPKTKGPGGGVGTLDDPNGGWSPISVSPCSPVSPLTTPPGLSQNSSRVSLPSPVQVSPATAVTPFTPLDQQVKTMFDQKTLPTKTIQPVIHELGSGVLLSPADSVSPVLELGASPVTSSRYSRASVATVPRGQQQRREGGPQQRQRQAQEGGVEEEDDADRHWPYLAYMARKQAVACSRWSIRRSRTNSEGPRG